MGDGHLIAAVHRRCLPPRLSSRPGAIPPSGSVHTSSWTSIPCLASQASISTRVRTPGPSDGTEMDSLPTDSPSSPNRWTVNPFTTNPRRLPLIPSPMTGTIPRLSCAARRYDGGPVDRHRAGRPLNSAAPMHSGRHSGASARGAHSCHQQRPAPTGPRLAALNPGFVPPRRPLREPQHRSPPPPERERRASGERCHRSRWLLLRSQ